jgi:hypothetical protein
MGGNSLDLVAGAETLEAKAAASRWLANGGRAGMTSSHVETESLESNLLLEVGFVNGSSSLGIVQSDERGTSNP